MDTLIQSTQTLYVAPAADTAEMVARLIGQIETWRTRCEKAEAQLAARDRRYMTLAVLAAGRVAVVRTPDGEYVVLKSIAQFRRPEIALVYAQRAEREMLDGLFNEE